jgi:type IV pilus assembly protein PilM
MKADGRRCSLGIDIGSHTVKTILLEDTPDGFVVRQAGRMPTPPGALLDGAVVKPGEIAACIRSMLARSGLRIRSASVSVPAEHVFVKTIEVPEMDRDSLHAATRFEARKYLPYPADTADIELHPVAQTGPIEEKRMHALLTAAPRRIVRSRAEALEAADLDVDAVEPEPFALFRALNLSISRHDTVWRGQAQAFLQIGERTCGMWVSQGVEIRFIRAIAWGAERITQSLVQSLDIPDEEARSIKESSSARVEQDGSLNWPGYESDGSAALAEELNRLCREIQRLLNYYRSLYPERSYEGNLDRIVLCGGTAGLEGLAEYLSGLLQIEVRGRNPFRSVGSRFSTESFEAVRGHKASFGAAIGLALGGMQSGWSATRADGRMDEFVWRREVA